MPLPVGFPKLMINFSIWSRGSRSASFGRVPPVSLRAIARKRPATPTTISLPSAARASASWRSSWPLSAAPSLPIVMFPKVRRDQPDRRTIIRTGRNAPRARSGTPATPPPTARPLVKTSSPAGCEKMPAAIRLPKTVLGPVELHRRRTDKRTRQQDNIVAAARPQHHAVRPEHDMHASPNLRCGSQKAHRTPFGGPSFLELSSQSNVHALPLAGAPPSVAPAELSRSWAPSCPREAA